MRSTTVGNGRAAHGALRWRGFAIPRDEPRRADDLARWVTTAVAKRAGVLGLGLSGREDGQAIGQFERAFRTVEKKEFPARRPCRGCVGRGRRREGA